MKKEVVYQECLYKEITGEDISLQELRKNVASIVVKKLVNTALKRR